MILSATGARVVSQSATPIPSEDRLALFRSMLKVRLVEERIQKLYPEGDMRCPTHLSLGQEAVAAGVCEALKPEDYVISAHRSHAHYIARGGSIRAMFAELYGKADGCASGKGGSMHLIDLDVNFLGCVPIVGSTIPIGVGAAFGAVMQRQDAVSVVFFGDGAAETGVFHESINFAATRKLPVLFVCENNLYSVNTPLDPRQPLSRTIADLAHGHGIQAAQHDGQEVEPIYAAACDAMEQIRRGGGPVLLEFMTYRWAEHCGPLGDLHLGYRSQAEFEAWTARDPVTLHRHALEKLGALDEAGCARMQAEIEREIDDAVEFARASPFPARSELAQGVYA
jgi:pyruvate dehydrogenase E1 component alpha subunit